MDKTKTIGLLIPEPIGYSETFFSSKVNGLMKVGFRVIIFCAKGKHVESEFEHLYQWPLMNNPLLRGLQLITGFLRLLMFPKRSLRFIRFQRQQGESILRVLKGLYLNGHMITGPSLDFIHFGFATMGIGREVMGKALRCKLSTSFRGYDVAIYPTKHGVDCYEKLWEHLDKVHTISDDLIQLAHENLSLPTNIPFQKITPAVDTQKFSQLNERSFFTEGKIRILSIGRLHWKKGQEYAFQALKKIKESGVNFQYTIAGEGEDWERLHFARKQLGLEESITFLGKVAHSEIPELMKGYDVFLQPSVQEGFGNAVLEAQAAGMLCVVTDAEGLPENVLHEKTGWVMAKRDPNALAMSILEVFDKPQEELINVSINARKRVINEFNIETQNTLFFEFFTK